MELYDARQKQDMILRTPTWTIGFLLAIALVPLGSAPTRAEYVLVVATTTLFLITKIPGVFRGIVAETGTAAQSASSTIALLGLPILVAIQVIAATTTDYTDAAIIEMLRAGLVLFATVLFYSLVYDTMHDHRSYTAMVKMFALVGSVEAAYGVFNLLSGNQTLLFYSRWAYHDSATGTLVNRNHFALLIELCLPVALINAGSARSKALIRALRPGDDIAQRMVMASAIIIMGLALVFSRSRMGVLSFIAACLVVLPLAQMLRPKADVKTALVRGQLLIPGVSILFVLVYVLVIGLTPAFERFANLASDLETGRLPIWRAAYTMALEKPILGHGWGSFASLITGYKPEPSGLKTLYAHNDYLQVFAETGLVGLIFVSWLLLRFARSFLASLSEPLAAESRRVLTWLGTGIVAALIHSVADFGLRIPGVGFAFAGVLALFVRVSVEPTIVLPPRRRRRRQGPDRETN